MKENWKLVLASFMLVLVGMGLIAGGICVSVIPVPNVEQIVFYVAGAICFIPGIVSLPAQMTALIGFRVT